MTNKLISEPASAMSPLGFVPTSPSRSVASSSNAMTAWPEYLTDALQRSVLFLELLRQRGNEEIARVPVVLTSRADTAAARRFSAAAAVL